MKRVFVAAALLAGLTFAFAQEPEMGPPAELKKLDWMKGEWTGKVKWDMPGMESTQEETSMKVEAEGNFLKCSSTMKMGPMTMTEVQYIGWNPKTSKYDSWTFTNFAPTPRVEHGTIDGDKFVTVSDPWDVPGMDGVVGRATITRKGDKEAGFMLEFKMGEEWLKVAEGSMTKK